MEYPKLFLGSSLDFITENNGGGYSGVEDVRHAIFEEIKE